MKTIIWALYAIAPVALLLGDQVKDGKSIVYRKLDVPSTVMERGGVSTQNMTALSKIICALQANRHLWCYLFCFKKDTDVCTLYDIQLPANYEAVDDDNPKIQCYTNIREGCVDGKQVLLEGKSRIEDNIEVICLNATLIKRCIDVDSNQTILEGESHMEDNYEVSCLNKTLIKSCVEGNLTVLEGETIREDTLEATCSNKELIKKCVYEDQIYSEGTTRWERSCFHMTCRQGAWGFRSDFVSVNGTGNIKVTDTIPKNFEDSKQCCQYLGARLVIPDNFEALNQYMMNNYDGSIYWVGITNGKWMDGRNVDANDWFSGEPGVGADCAYIYHGYNWLLNGVNCSNIMYGFICQKV